MRLKKLEDYVELPKSLGFGQYGELRSIERIDIRPGERRDVLTGVGARIAKTETVTVYSAFCDNKMVYDRTGEVVELMVRIKNNGKQNIMLHPGQVIATIEVKKGAAKTKTATIRTKAAWRPENK